MFEHRPATERTRDLVVAGGGIAGLALALAIKRGWPSAGVTICDPRLDASAQKAGRSLRALALAAGSRHFLDDLGIWARIEAKAQPMTRMVITDSRPEDRPRPVYIEFDGEAGPEEPFAHMVFQDDLHAVLVEACHTVGIRFQPSRVDGFHDAGGALAVECGDAVLRTRLLVAADGARSRLRDAAGIKTIGWDYGQAGIVATISHEIPHEGRATQHFLPHGPLALLPLKAADGSPRRFSLVWSESLAEARRLTALPGAEFLAELESRIGYEYGALSLDDVPSAYPLRLVLSRRLVAKRLALIGDAARTMHPLAGQGLNLGLRDAAALAELVLDHLSLGLDPGDAGLLDRYQRMRRLDSVVMAGLTDGLNRLFSNDSLPARLARDLGLGLVDRIPRLKQFLIRDAAGLSGVLPRGFG